MNCQYLERAGKPKLAYHYTLASNQDGDLPTIIFMGGFKSDMNGTKANFLENQCKERGHAFLRFDYSGHGLSEGRFEECTISVWKQDALDMFDHIKPEKAILIGSSMGGWISLLLGLERMQRVSAIIGIAAAPDFTNDLWFNRLNHEQRERVEQTGSIEVPNDYSPEPYIFTKALFDDGRTHFLLEKQQKLNIPVTLIQGMQDPDVPWETTARIQNAFPDADIDVVLIEDGDHSLSRPEDLEILDKELMALVMRNENNNVF